VKYFWVKKRKNILFKKERTKMERKMILLIFVILKYSLIETDLKEETYFVLK